MGYASWWIGWRIDRPLREGREGLLVLRRWGGEAAGRSSRAPALSVSALAKQSEYSADVRAVGDLGDNGRPRFLVCVSSPAPSSA